MKNSYDQIKATQDDRKDAIMKRFESCINATEEDEYGGKVLIDMKLSKEIYGLLREGYNSE